MTSSPSPRTSEDLDDGIMKVPHEFMEFPLGFVIDAGGSVTKLLYRSKKDYKDGKLLKTSDRGILRLKYFNAPEIDNIIPFLKNHCDVIESEKNFLDAWLMTGVTTQHFKAKLQEEFGIKTKLYSEMQALQTVVKIIDDLEIGHYEINQKIFPRIVKFMRVMLEALPRYSKMGDDSLKKMLNMKEDDKDVSEKLDNSVISEPEHQQQLEKTLPLTELVFQPEVDWNKWSDQNLESAQGKLVTPSLFVLFGSACVIFSTDEEKNIKAVDFMGIAGKAFCGIVDEMLGVNDFDTFMKMAEKGNVDNVNIHHGDLKSEEHKEEDWYSDFPPDTLVFELGKLASSYGIEKGKYTKDDVAAGILNHQASIISKVLILNCRLHKLNTVYMCGSLVKYRIAREMIEKQFFMESLRYHLDGSPIVKVHFLQNPGFMVGLGVWSTNVDICRMKKQSLV